MRDDNPTPTPQWACDRCRATHPYDVGSLRAGMTYEGNVVLDTDDFNIARLCLSCAASLGRWWNRGE